MDTIKFGNGEVHSCSFFASLPNGDAFIALDDVDFPQAAAIFADDEKTAEIEYGNYRLLGYTLNTHGTGLFMQPYGVQAVLKGGRYEFK